MVHASRRVGNRHSSGPMHPPAAHPQPKPPWRHPPRMPACRLTCTDVIVGKHTASAGRDWAAAVLGRLRRARSGHRSQHTMARHEITPIRCLADDGTCNPATGFARWPSTELRAQACAGIGSRRPGRCDPGHWMPPAGEAMPGWARPRLNGPRAPRSIPRTRSSHPA
jgi:hypothetical protein